MKMTKKITALLSVFLASTGAMSADWSSNSIGYRYAPSQSEPGVSDKVSKNIATFTMSAATGSAPTFSQLTCSSQTQQTPPTAGAAERRNGIAFTSATSPSAP